MTDDSHAIREALNRYVLASARHRAAIGRLLQLSDNEVLAVTHLRRSGPLTPTALGRLLSLTSGGTTALVQRLERDGRVVRERHPGDGRSTLVRLSPGAARSVDEATAPLADALEASVTALSEAERDVVRRFLAEVAHLAEEEADRASLAAIEHERIAIGEPVPSLSL